MTEHTYNRLDLAAEQLDVALILFLENQSYVSALTLAGAAEEIFGKALSHQGKANVLDYKYESIESLHSALHGKPLLRADFFQDENNARNAVKHMGSPSDATVTADFEDAALWMIVRACDNYERLGLPRTERMFKFDEWFHNHVVGTQF
jgi:hypothetical protein